MKEATERVAGGGGCGYPQRMLRGALWFWVLIVPACATETQLGPPTTPGVSGSGGASGGTASAGSGTAGSSGSGSGEAGSTSAGSGGAGDGGTLAMGGTAGSAGMTGGGSGGAGGTPSNCPAGGPVSGFKTHVTNEADRLEAKIDLRNDGTIPVSLCQISARYYFGIDTDAGVTATVEALEAWRNPLNPGDPKVAVGTVSPAVPGADRYIEVTFPSSTLQLLQYEWVRVRISLTPQQTDQTNDYSYAGPGEHKDSPLVTVYRSGILVWGVEPTAP